MKKAAGIEACNYIKSGMTIGLGTGSTIKYTILELAKRLNEGELEGITAISTSIQTEELAKKCKIPLTDWDNFTDELDLTIDGADEIDPELNLIKGGGGALLREKIVAEASNKYIIVSDATKAVEALGSFPLPIEINLYGLKRT